MALVLTYPRSQLAPVSPITEPLLPEPITFEVEKAIEKLKEHK
jgi:hypothetical protein